METIEQDYKERFPILEKLADAIKSELIDTVKPLPHIDIVTARPKTLKRFLEKAIRKDYKNPLKDIQDQVGARIVVFYLSDVAMVREAVLKDFVISEDKPREPIVYSQFDYEGHHMICSIPLDIRQKFSSPVEVFELQISTLFQHAWAQANHDVGYKPGELPADKDSLRKIAWAAAQAWGADKIFDEIYQLNQKIKIVK